MLYVDIRYEELSLVVVAYNQIKGVHSPRLFRPGCWPPYLLPKYPSVIILSYKQLRLDTLNLPSKSQNENYYAVLK